MPPPALSRGVLRFWFGPWRQAFCAGEVGLIRNHPADADGARLRIGGKGIDDGLSVRDCLLRRLEDFVDDRNLCGMDGHFCRKAVAPRCRAFAAEAFDVPE